MTNKNYRFVIKNILQRKGKTVDYLLKDRKRKITYPATRIATLHLIAEDQVEDASARQIRGEFYATGLSGSLAKKAPLIVISEKRQLLELDQIMDDDYEIESVDAEQLKQEVEEERIQSIMEKKGVTITQLSKNEIEYYKGISESTQTLFSISKTIEPVDLQVLVGYSADVPIYWNIGKSDTLLLEYSKETIEPNLLIFLAEQLLKNRIGVAYIKVGGTYDLPETLTSNQGFSEVNTVPKFKSAIQSIGNILDKRIKEVKTQEDVNKLQRLALIIDDIDTLYMALEDTEEVSDIITNILDNGGLYGIYLIVGTHIDNSVLTRTQRIKFKNKAGSVGTPAYKATKRPKGLPRCNRGEEYGITSQSLKFRIRQIPNTLTK